MQQVNQQQNQQQNQKQDQQQKKHEIKTINLIENCSKILLKKLWIKKTILIKEVFWDYFKCQNLLCLEKFLTRAAQAKHEQILNTVNDGLINLRNDSRNY